MVRQRAESNRRLFAVLFAATAMAFTAFTGAPAAQAQEGSWDPQDACDPDTVPDSGFDDAVGTHGAAIECLAWFGLTRGQTATSYDNLGNIRRDQTATFVVRTLQRIEGLSLPDRATDPFTDVTGGVHQGNVETLAGFDPQIVAGFEDGTYGPALPITRAQFASITTRMLDELADQDLLTSLPEAESPFADTAGSVHEENIARLAAAGIVLGTSETTFEPTGTITRGQVASIFSRVLGGLADRGLIMAPVLVEGVVHEATDVQPGTLGPGLDGAIVSATGVSEVATTTSNDGEYELWLQARGEYVIAVSAADFQTREILVRLPDENIDDGVDVGLYRSGVAPENSTRTTSTAASVTVTSAGDFWVVGLGPGLSASDADQIVLRFPNGVVIELGGAGTDGAWFSRNADGTSQRIGAASGVHEVFYDFDGDWRRLDVRFNADGTLDRVNNSAYSDPDS